MSKPELVDGLVLSGDQAWTPEEWAAGAPARKRRLERRRESQREWVARNPDRVREYAREWRNRNSIKLGRKPHVKRRVAVRYEQASLHDLACGGKTKATGCVCRKVMVARLAEAT